MSIEKELSKRSNHQCELCKSKDNLAVYQVAPSDGRGIDGYVFMCATCQNQIEGNEPLSGHHWRCLNESMWSDVPAVQVVSWRMLHRLKDEDWTQELIDMLYLDEETQAWAQASGDHLSEDEKTIHKDAYGVVLQAGDTVILTQDLKVKGANFTAKKGTVVRRISLVFDNAEQVEGRIENQQIVILTKYVKKQKN